MMPETKNQRDEAAVAAEYDKTRDLSGFEGGDDEKIQVRRNVTISVRFSQEEINLLRAAAEEANQKVTAYIREAALQHGVDFPVPKLIEVLYAAQLDLGRAVEIAKHGSIAESKPLHWVTGKKS